MFLTSRRAVILCTCATGLRIMASGDEVGPTLARRIEKEPKLNLLIAHNVGIWCAPSLVLGQHVVYHFVFVVVLKIKNDKVDTQLHCDPLGIS